MTEWLEPWAVLVIFYAMIVLVPIAMVFMASLTDDPKTREADDYREEIGS